ncbi:MAG: hydroxymethylglutaryl-CoA reductase, degradative [Candidatus Bathyarchaeia archaeon]
MSKTSRISDFYKLSPRERIQIVKKFADLSREEVEVLLGSTGSLTLELADRMIENVVGAFPVPLGIAVNFLINGRDYLIPMAIEEPSVVAAASYGAKMARQSGFFTSSTESIMIGQVQVVDVPGPDDAKKAILAAKEELLSKANEGHRTTNAKDLDVKVIQARSGPMVIVELLVDCKDIMGANVVDSMAEAIASLIERITGGRVYLRIVSNLATKRMAKAWTTVPREAVGGEEVVEGIVEAWAFAAADPYRTATHNKGIMNGITGVVLATGNDVRAVEAGAHAYAALPGRYLPLSRWKKTENGDLHGEIELPLAVGIIGGTTKAHPVARVALKILGVKSARELAEVSAAVGLAQNLAALRALADEGIQRGHMKLHARSLAISVGATGELVDIIVQKMIEEHNIKMSRAEELLKNLKEKKIHRI